jgi:predicted porin
MKKELLIASALTASFGLAGVVEAASASYSGSVTAGATGDDLDSTSSESYSAVQTSELSFSISETTDSGIKISTGLEIIDEGGNDNDESGLTLTFTNGSTLDLIEAGGAYGGALASVPAAGGEQGITDVSGNNAPTDLDWADTQDAVGFDWGSAADFAGIEGLTVGLSAAFGDDGDASTTSTAEQTYSMGATYAMTAGDTAVTIGGGFTTASNSNAATLNNQADSSAVSISAVTGNLTVGAGFSTGSGMASNSATTTATTTNAALELDAANYMEAGASYVSGDLTFTVNVTDGEAKDEAIGSNGAGVDSTETVSASAAYTIASGVTATLGYTDVSNSNEGAAIPANSGSSWYVGASVSF